EYRCHESHEYVEDLPKRGLRRAARRTVGAPAVEPILDDVEVERAQVHAAEVVERMVNDVELVLEVRAPAACDERACPREDPLVEFEQRIRCDRVARRIEV